MSTIESLDARQTVKRLRTYRPGEDDQKVADKNDGRTLRVCIRCRQEIVIWRGENAPPVPTDYTCFRCRE